MTRARPSAHPHPKRRSSRALADTSFTRAAGLFRAAGDEARLRLLHALDGGERCVSELAANAGTKLSTLSQQLRVLLSERMVVRRRVGKHVYYQLADDHVRSLIRAALEHAEEH